MLIICNIIIFENRDLDSTNIPVVIEAPYHIQELRLRVDAFPEIDIMQSKHQNAYHDLRS